MPVADQAKTAIAALNGKEIYGRQIALSEAEERGKDISGNFQRSKREYRKNDDEIDGNRW